MLLHLLHKCLWEFKVWIFHIKVLCQAILALSFGHSWLYLIKYDDLRDIHVCDWPILICCQLHSFYLSRAFFILFAIIVTALNLLDAQVL